MIAPPSQPSLTATGFSGGTSAAVDDFVQNARCGVSLPAPGHGETAERFASLRRSSHMNASVGRLLEAHEDAVAILAEAAVLPPAHTSLAVWASGPTDNVRLTRNANSYTLSGSRSFCGGAAIVDAALVLCESSEGEQIVLVDVTSANVHVDPTSWTVPAFREAGICTVHFDDIEVTPPQCIGPPNWYGARSGFWFGAMGVAALWAGLADSLFERLPELQRRKDSLSELAFATIDTSMWSVSALLSYAADRIDGHHTDRRQPNLFGMVDAVSCRHAIRTHIDVAIKCFDEEVGPAPYVRDAALAQLRSELAIALSQHHGQRDLLMLRTVR